MRLCGSLSPSLPLSASGHRRKHSAAVVFKAYNAGRRERERKKMRERERERVALLFFLSCPAASLPSFPSPSAARSQRRRRRMPHAAALVPAYALVDADAVVDRVGEVLQLRVHVEQLALLGKRVRGLAHSVGHRSPLCKQGGKETEREGGGKRERKRRKGERRGSRKRGRSAGQVRLRVCVCGTAMLPAPSQRSYP